VEKGQLAARRLKMKSQKDRMTKSKQDEKQKKKPGRNREIAARYTNYLATKKQRKSN